MAEITLVIAEPRQSWSAEALPEAAMPELVLELPLNAM